MTYAYLKKYSINTDKRGFYIDGPNWTLQTSHRADRFFRQSPYRHDTELPLTVVKTLVHLGEAETGDRTRKDEILDWFPHLNPSYCDMSDAELNDLQSFIEKNFDNDDMSERELTDFTEFLRHQTPLDPSPFS